MQQDKNKRTDATRQKQPDWCNKTETCRLNVTFFEGGEGWGCGEGGGGGGTESQNKQMNFKD